MWAWPVCLQSSQTPTDKPERKTGDVDFKIKQGGNKSLHKRSLNKGKYDSERKTDPTIFCIVPKVHLRRMNQLIENKQESGCQTKM